MCKHRSVKRTAHFDRVGRNTKPGRQREPKSVAAAAKTGLLKVLAIAIGENLADQSAAGVNVETDRRFGMFRVLRPTFDDMRRDPIDRAAQRTARSAIASTPVRRARRAAA